MTRLARPYDSSRTPLILENSSLPRVAPERAFVAVLRGLVVLPDVARTPGALQGAYRIG